MLSLTWKRRPAAGRDAEARQFSSPRWQGPVVEERVGQACPGLILGPHRAVCIVSGVTQQFGIDLNAAPGGRSKLGRLTLYPEW